MRLRARAAVSSLILPALGVGLVASCGSSENDGSRVFIDSKNAKVTQERPGVVYLESPEPCTASFIGKDTIIAAAHCVSIDGTVTYIDGRGKTHRSTQIWHHGVFGPSAPAQLLPHAVQRDVMVARFSDVNAPEIVKMGFDTLSPGDGVRLMGYALSLKTPGYKRGDKVTDLTTIARVSDKAVLLSGFPAVNGGDSGGPLLLVNNGKTHGVASFGQPHLPDNDRTSVYALLSHPENIALLHRAADEGASVPRADLPPLVKRQPSSLAVLGKFKGSQVCSRGGIADFCEVTLDFQRGAKLVLSGLPSGDSRLTYRQTKDQLVVERGVKPVDSRASKTQSKFAVYNNATMLVSEDGATYLRESAPSR